MTHTVLLKEILERANRIKEEFGGEYLCASHIAVAVTDFCRTKYTGFAVSDMTYWPDRFEEERLRYVFSKETRVANYFRIRLSQNAKNGVQENAFDFNGCERIAALRKAEVLSSDVVFLSALASVHESYRRIVQTVNSEEAVLNRLQDVDANVYNYVIEHIEEVCAELKKKSDEATAIRDWKPATKFAEPEELPRLAFDGIATKHTGTVTTVRIPKFFGNTGLTLSVHRVDGIYYVHDNRCALRYLARRLQDADQYERAVRKVCHKHRIDKGRITGSFSNVTGFMYYIKDLVFVAQADLYYPSAKHQLCFKDKGYVYIPEDQAEPFEEAELINMLKESVNAYYDENMGLCCWLNAGNSPFQTRYSFLVETVDDGHIRFSDRLKGKYEGELLEPCYWYHDSTDISAYGRLFTRFAERFGGEFDGKNIYLTARSKDFQRALFQFFQLATLVSRLGHSIALPKLTCKR